MAPARLDRLPTHDLRGRLSIAEATGLTGRLLGLAFLDRLAADQALLIPRCRSIHTFGMRFAIDAVFLGEGGHPLRVARGLSPHRVASVRAAIAVLETRAGHADRFLAAGADELAVRLSRRSRRAAAGGR